MAEAAAKEPSMEDILSSIRKIIAEEETAPAQDQAYDAEPAAVAAEPAIDVGDMRPAIDTHSEAEITSDPVMSPRDELIHQSNPAATSAMYEQEAPAVVAESSIETTMAEPQAEPAPVEPAVEVDSEPTAAAPSGIPAPIAEAPVAETAASVTAGVSLASIAAGLKGEGNVAEAPVASAAPEETYQESVAAEPEQAFEAPQPVESVAAEYVPEPAPAPMEEVVDMAAAVPAPNAEDMAREEEAFRGALMSPSSNGAVTDSFDRLKRSAMDDIEAKTEAILRPMLREWLDENLPSLVEKLVREEIERVARG